MVSDPPISLRIKAYAKINLTLDVFSKRPDGYHSIASVLQAISLHDALQIRRNAGVSFTCDGPEAAGIPLDDSNLALRAARLVLKAAGDAAVGVAIHLHKLIPSQAGLGGGSGDAAATLVGVNRLIGSPLAPEELHEIAASIGSDVPYFLSGGAAVARDRGQLISQAEDIPQMWLVIVKPEDSVSTGWAYGELDSDPNRSSHRGTKRMESAIAERDQALIVARMCNDFELPVFAAFPAIAALSDDLLMAGAQTVRLCGSGSAMFGVAGGEADAESIARRLRSKYAKVYVARTLSKEECSKYLLPDG